VQCSTVQISTADIYIKVQHSTVEVHSTAWIVQHRGRTGKVKQPNQRSEENTAKTGLGGKEIDVHV
jgi:hypothetical protein